jgi:O-antigen/teichoic acid export membrane protein
MPSAERDVRLSYIFSGIDKYVSLLLTLALTAIVARLLRPDEIGVFVVSYGIVLLGETVRDFGASAYIVQEKDLSAHDIKTTFTVVFGVSLLIAGGLGLAAPWIGHFYSDPRLAPAIQIAAIGVVAGAFAAPPMALLRREMQFKTLAIINVAGLAINLIGTLALIACGWRYLSLPMGALMQSVFVAAAAVLWRREFWIFRPCLVHWRRIMGFGGYASATTLLNNLYNQLPQLLLGQMIGLDKAGLFSRATTLCQLPDRAIVGAFQPVLLPILSIDARAGKSLKAPYLYGLSLLSSVQWPILICLAILAEPVVRVVLGPQWDQAAPILRIMALAWVVMMPAPLTYPVLVAVGRVRDTLTASFVSLPVSAGVVALAAPHGMQAIAVSMFLTLPIQVGVAVYLIRRQIGFAWTDLFRATAKSTVVCLFAAAVPAGCLAAFGARPDLPIPVLILAVAGAAIGWLAGLVATRHPLLAELRATAGLVRQSARARRSAPSLEPADTAELVG